MLGDTIQHYKVGQKLGEGGMGEVYLAEDVRLGRPVALKFLPAALKADPDSRARLLNEARAASLLRSPNIAVTYDIGEHAGTDFIVMEFVEGELLSQRIAQGPLPVREAVDVGVQVADALDEAHSRGIIHRDIKSANLIRTDRGLVKVLDFGLAKFLATKQRSELVTQPQMTVAGMVVGTISYMSPEQALGRSVDHRADLFSLGVVLYELATGRIPFAGTSPTEIVDKILHETPLPPSSLNAVVPKGLDAIVARAMEKSPTFRYQTAHDMRQDLRELAGALEESFRVSTSRAAVAIASQQASAIERSVAVMTFANITREPADDWIGTGIAETVSSDLKNIHGLTVIGRARVYDALRNLASSANLDESLAIDIGRRLGATWVVVGGFQKMSELVRITANFVDVATGAVRQTVKVDGRVADIFALQDKIVYELSQGLNVVLRGTEVAEIERRETKSVEAYESFARGMMSLRLASRDSIERAIAAFEHATRKDPEYALAWAALGGAYSLKGSFLSVRDLIEDAIEIERRALSIDPELADAHTWLGVALLSLGRTDEAIVAIREAIRLEPDNGQAHQALARAYWVGRGDFASAIPEFEKAIELNPEAGYSYLQLALLLAWEGQYARAEEVSRRAVELQDQVHLGQRRAAGRRRERPPRLRLLPAGPLRRRPPRVRTGPVVRRLERPCPEGSHRHRAEHQDGRGLPAAGPAGRSRPSLRSRAQDVRQPDREGRRRSVHPLLHRRHARAHGRCRPRVRIARAGRRAPAGADRRTRAPRPGSGVVARGRALRCDCARGECAIWRATPSHTPIPRRHSSRQEVAGDRRTIRLLHQMVGGSRGIDVRDVVIVGAGPAGLSAALMLGRCRRSVLVVDHGRNRNAASHALHGFLTRDGTPPAEFLGLAREELAQYATVELRAGEVVDAECRSDSFCVTLASGEEVSSRKLLLATGVVDNLPEVPGFRELYGRSVFHCPYCDGWELREQPLAIYGRGDRGVGVALELTAWSRDLVLCTDGPAEIEAASLERLARHGIAVREERMTSLEGDGDGVLQRIVFAQGEPLARRALFFSTGQYQRSDLLIRLGCEFNDKGTVRTGKYETTHLPGLFVAGDASRAVQWVVVAAAEGAEAAFAINTDLLKEDLERR